MFDNPQYTFGAKTLHNTAATFFPFQVGDLATLQMYFGLGLDADAMAAYGIDELGRWIDPNAPGLLKQTITVEDAALPQSFVIGDMTNPTIRPFNQTSAQRENASFTHKDSLRVKFHSIFAKFLVKLTDVHSADITIYECTSKLTRPFPEDIATGNQHTDAREVLCSEAFYGSKHDDASLSSGTYGDSATSLVGDSRYDLSSDKRIDSYDPNLDLLNNSIVKKFWSVKKRKFHVLRGQEIKFNSSIKSFDFNPDKYRMQEGTSDINMDIVKGVTKVYCIKVVGELGQDRGTAAVMGDIITDNLSATAMVAPVVVTAAVSENPTNVGWAATHIGAVQAIKARFQPYVKKVIPSIKYSVIYKKDLSAVDLKVETDVEMKTEDE